jgi:hypothetical protein
MSCNKKNPSEIINDIEEIIKDVDGYIAPSITVLKDIENIAPQHKEEIEKVIAALKITDQVIPLLNDFLSKLADILGK